MTSNLDVAPEHIVGLSDTAGKKVHGPVVRVRQWSGKGWDITLTKTELELAQATGRIVISSDEAARFGVRRRWWRWGLDQDGDLLVRLRGLRKLEASALATAFKAFA